MPNKDLMKFNINLSFFYYFLVFLLNVRSIFGFEKLKIVYVI